MTNFERSMQPSQIPGSQFWSSIVNLFTKQRLKVDSHFCFHLDQTVRLDQQIKSLNITNTFTL